MSEVSRARRVTIAQLEQLWELLDEDRSVATGYHKTSQAREYNKRAWERIAQNLNSHGDGAIKDGKAWCKVRLNTNLLLSLVLVLTGSSCYIAIFLLLYWNDFKSKLKKHVAAARASQQRTGGGPSNERPLTDIEKKFLRILGEDFGAGLIGIRVEPFEGEPIRQPDPETPVLLSEENGSHSQSILIGLPDFVNLFPDELIGARDPVPGPTNRVTPPPTPQISEPSQVLRSPAAHFDLSSRTPPRRSPRAIVAPRARSPAAGQQRRRLRRVTRREPPMGLDESRRALIQIARRRSEIEERRAEIEERNSALLRQLVSEMQEIKQILRER